MSAAKHTSGPWMVKGEKVYGAYGFRVAAVTAHYAEHVEQQRVNARLIALAPELLAIAQKLAKLREGLENGNSSAEYAAAELARTAAAVVAKATGDV